MMLKNVFAVLVFFLMSTSVFALDDNVHSYKAYFKNGNEYNIKTTPNYLSWEGTKGEEKGMADIIKNFQHVTLRKGVDVYQWVSDRGAFNVVIVDKDNKKIITTGKNSKEQWVWEGHLEPWTT